MMEIVQSWIAPRTTERAAAGGDLIADYHQRSARYCPCERESFLDEGAFWGWVEKQGGRGRTFIVLLDSRGKQMSSEAFAERLGRLRDDGVRRLVLAIGPADGWTAASRERADLLLSFGLMTLPHQLARVVLAEQVYRALTILAGHPYHCGH
ncbi:23S rRNA (pseudouridine(1915)-N(3))-methyltransferase RlmH [Granulicella sibirica]|uniref:Ribosomal RNA large subunit methyltransferase H n=1 Tax=Granulicella sibirica TaxID=2479048 RepID=A0A4Q0T4T9_9BACT|nr:23S rRNA (pseudouridine(1915)-N(3))-methyltransferase RlmH [Granulicella sibirica]RXH58367.1 LSU m3Psi1915 methyltransferase RlmH [Granulicella sibirica]